MKKVFILKGLPASGKSTWAKQLLDQQPHAYKRINKDDLRAMLDNGHWSKDSEKLVLRLRDWLIAEALQQGKHVISDDTNLAPAHETRIRQVVADYEATSGDKVEVVVKFFDVSVEECIRRDLKRPQSVGERVIRQMYRQFINPLPRHPKPLDQDPALPKAIICDLDGTLAIFDRNPFDASTCEQDRLNTPVAHIVTTYHAIGHAVLLVSGRFDTYRPQTERWLAAHGISYQALFMRPAADTRKDAILKKEIFDTHLKGKWFIEFVLDDRNQVVEMWRREGLTCCQVAEGDF